MDRVERIGRFEVQERLRANPFVVVYRGRDPFDGRRVQIRFCVATDDAIRKRFLSAAEEAAILRHPNVASVFEFGSGEGKPYLVQEAFSEESLSDLLARGEPLDDVLRLYYLVQIAKGLHYAHGQEVLHRELRPASILVNRRGDVKIADFGTARLASAVAQLGNGAHRWPAVGWLVPELLLGLELDARSDIYGFGAVAFELLTGKPPFLAESLAELVPLILESDPRPLGVYWAECPPELDRLVLRCLSRDPAQRFASMEEVVAELGMIVPVTASEDVVEEETTMVIEDIQTAYITPPPEEDTTSLPEPERPRDRERIAAEEPRVSRRSWFDREAAVRWSRGAAERMAIGVVSASKLALRGASGLVTLLASHRRITTAVALAILLSAVVGWALVGMMERTGEPLPSVSPPSPIVPVAQKSGRLLIDAQPWGEVVRILDRQGKSIDLSNNPFTPVVFELGAGEYRVEVSRPELDRIETCYVTVDEGMTSSCELALAEVDTAEFFKQTGWWQ